MESIALGQETIDLLFAGDVKPGIEEEGSHRQRDPSRGSSYPVWRLQPARAKPYEANMRPTLAKPLTD